MLGNGQLSRSVRSFNPLYATHFLNIPSFFFAMTIGAHHGPSYSMIFPVATSSSMFFLRWQFALYYVTHKFWPLTHPISPSSSPNFSTTILLNPLCHLI